jgi:hypothetical protein
MRTCQQCCFFAPIEAHPAGAGVCCGEPPKAFPTMTAPGSVMRPGMAAQPMTIGLDPPVAADRRACRYFQPVDLN